MGDIVEATLGVGYLMTAMNEKDQQKWKFMEKVVPWLETHVINHYIGWKEQGAAPEDIKEEAREEDVAFIKRKLSEIQRDVSKIGIIEAKLNEVIQGKRQKMDETYEPAIQNTIPKEEAQEIQNYWNDKHNSNEAWVSDEDKVRSAVGKPQAVYHGNLQGHIFRYIQKEQGCPYTESGWMSWGYVYKQINDPNV